MVLKEQLIVPKQVIDIIQRDQYLDQLLFMLILLDSTLFDIYGFIWIIFLSKLSFWSKQFLNNIKYIEVRNRKIVSLIFWMKDLTIFIFRYETSFLMIFYSININVWNCILYINKKIVTYIKLIKKQTKILCKLSYHKYSYIKLITICYIF